MGKTALLILTLVGSLPSHALAQWRQITAEQAVCGHSVLFRIDGKTKTVMLLHGEKPVDTLTAALGRPIHAPGSKVACTLKLEQRRQEDFEDHQSGQRGLVIKEAVTATCDVGGTTVEISSGACIVGVGWDFGTGGDKGGACFGGAGKGTPDSFEYCPFGISMFSLNEAPAKTKQ
jgi:hypothetical protein